MTADITSPGKSSPGTASPGTAIPGKLILNAAIEEASRLGHRTICSAKGCRADATYGLLWNNPKLHTPERRKTWLACDDHVESLSDFLSRRGFLKDADTVADITGETGTPDS